MKMFTAYLPQLQEVRDDETTTMNPYSVQSMDTLTVIPVDVDILLVTKIPVISRI
jgi:hypothetical protein